MTPSLDRMRQNNFLIIGRAGMDLYPDPPGTRTEEASQFFACLGGSSANIGVAIVKSGGRASLVTSVSDDAIGRFCLNELDKYGIDRTFVKSVGGECRNSLAVVESRVEDHQSVIYRNNAADFQMTEEDVHSPDFGSFGALISTGTVLAAEPSRSACLSAFEAARDSALPIIFDIDYRPYSWESGEDAARTYTHAASFCDVIIGNDDEFDVMAGEAGQGFQFAKNLAAQGTNIVVYKMGEKGSVTFTSEGEEIATGIFEVEALKPTGAGDSFLGVFVSSLASGRNLGESVIRGSAAAALVVSRVGCAPAMPKPEEIDTFIETHPGLSEAG
ncbi:MAG: 5-dehydro-2-deoxygluconokinase [Methyloligellaceae bacterium]